MRHPGHQGLAILGVVVLFSGVRLQLTHGHILNASVRLVWGNGELAVALARDGWTVDSFSSA